MCSTRGAAKPGVSVSTMKALIPLRPPASGSVRAKTVRRFATEPWVMKRLRAVEDVVVAVARGAHPVGGDVAAGGGLGEGEGGQPLPGGEAREVSVLLLVGPGQQDRQGAELLDDRDQAGGGVGPGDLLDEDALRDRVEGRAAVALLEAGAEQVLLRQQLLEVPRELAASRRSRPRAARCAPRPARARRRAARRARRWAGRSRGLLAAKVGVAGLGALEV